jgi:putative phage-type endonuclease
MALAIRQNSPEWLEARKATIGSSDIAAIVGESPHKSAYTLAAEKLGLIPEVIDDETRELMDIGHLMQPVLLTLYERKTGRHPKAAPTWRAHPEYPWATASLDGTAPVKRVVEAKWTHAKRWRNGDRVPADVLLQVQWQLFVIGWDVADVIVLDHVQPRVEEVERDDKVIDDLLYFAREFMGYLERGELPPVDASESTQRALKARYPTDDGTWVEPNADLTLLTTALADARAAKKRAEDAERSTAIALREILGAATGIRGLLSAKQNKGSQRVNWPGVATAYRRLLDEVAGVDCVHLVQAMKEYAIEDLSLVESLHTDTAEGARPLRLLSKGTSE